MSLLSISKMPNKGYTTVALAILSPRTTTPNRKRNHQVNCSWRVTFRHNLRRSLSERLRSSGIVFNRRSSLIRVSRVQHRDHQIPSVHYASPLLLLNRPFSTLEFSLRTTVFFRKLINNPGSVVLPFKPLVITSINNHVRERRFSRLSST